MAPTYRIYVVGGAVRDALMGLPVKDRDYVVVGATPEQMKAGGFIAVGKDFPVFLHPTTHEEYALARTERKTAPGYTGFAFHAAPDVTLEQDLQRRDLTINAIAQDIDGTLIDPCGGQADIKNKVFRHVSHAFAEDPVRILRLARFAARFTEFSVAPQTATLMHQMVESGEVDALVSERVWQEIARGLMEAQPSRMFAVLCECRALKRLMPELDGLLNQSIDMQLHPSAVAAEKIMIELDSSAHLGASLPIRFSVIAYHLANEQQAIDLCLRLKLPNEVKELAVLVARERSAVHSAAEMSADAIVKLLERCDAFRKSDRFADLLKLHELIHISSHEKGSLTSIELLQASLETAKAVNAGEIAAAVAINHPQNPAQHIAAAVHVARVSTVQAILNRR
jgi:tRNA nucleotidyltransferase (CCA-adding enzyme)